VKTGKLKTEDIQTEVFFLPAAAVPEMDGSFTNTQRLVQWHDKAIDPPGDARSDIWFTWHLGRPLQELYRDSRRERGRASQGLTWDYLDDVANRNWSIKDEPSAEKIMREINGYDLRTGRLLDTFADLKDDGSTSSGAWIYTGIFAGGRNRAANRNADGWVSL